LQDRFNQEKDEREMAMADIRESQGRVGRAAQYGSASGADESTDQPGGGILSQQNSSRKYSDEHIAARKEQRRRYQFESTGSDDEVEDELDNNLDEISSATSRLKALGLAMGQEIDSQVTRLDRVDGKVGRLDNKIYMNTEKLKRIK